MKRKTGSSLVARIIATAVAAVVVITGTPATVLADGDGSGEVTVETVASDESAAESAVSTASTSVGTAQSADSTTNPVTASGVNNEDGTTETFNPAVTAGDVKTALGTAEDSLKELSKEDGNIANINKYLGELQSTDENGNPIGLLPSTAADVNTAKGSVNIVQTVLQPVTDENGDPVYIIQLDENGNEVKDENDLPVYVQQTKLVALIPEVDPDGNPIMIPEKDENGEDVKDENGNVKMVPMLKAVDFADIDKNTTGSADNAISSVKTANTSNSEYEAYTAAQTAVNELEKAEEGLLDAGKAVYEATEKVDQAEKDLAAAEAAKKAAQEKYDQLKAEIKNGQKNATAANEQLKAAEKYAKGLEQEAQKKYEEYLGDTENLAMLQTIDDCSKAFDAYIDENISKNADGTLVFKSDKNKGIKGYENDKEFWNKARDLSLALLEYSIKNGKLQAYNPENNDNPVSFEDGYKLVVGDNFKVTLTTHEDPENISDANVKYDENIQPYIELKEEVTNYEFDVKTGKWKDDKAVPGEKEAYASNKMIKVKNTDTNNRVVVTFRDSEGNEIGSLPQFYFNYKVNSDGTVYYYQRTFTKNTETVEGDDKAYLVSEGTTGYYKNGDSSDEKNNITKLNLKKDDVIVDKDENTKLYVHTGPAGKVEHYDVKDKQEKPKGAEPVKVKETDEHGHEHDKEKEEIEYSVVSYNGEDIVKKTVYKFYYTVTEELTSKNDNYKSGDGLSEDDLKRTVREYLLARGVGSDVVINTGNGNGPQEYEARYSDGTRVTFTVNVSYNGNLYSYTIGKEEYKTEKTETRYIAENSKGYKIKETYTAVKTDPVYAGYEGYTNETGITWESDSVKSGQFTPDAQQRAQRNGQLELAGDGRSYTNATAQNGYFDYKKALELKHLAEKYNQASKDVATASAATQKLKDDIDKLTVQYNGLKSGDIGYKDGDPEKDPQNALYQELQRLDNEISKLRQNLNSANYELAIAKKELGNLETKVQKARDAVAAIDLSRFNGGNDDDNGDDAGDDSGSPSDTADTGDITVVDEIPVISYIPTADAAPSGVAGVRTGRTASRSGVAGVRVEAGDEADAAEKSAATKTVAASDTADKKAADTDDSGKNGSKKVVKIANNEVPLVETPFEEGMQFNWLWLLAVAAAVIAAIYIYDNRKRKAEAENELKKYDKK